MKTYIADVIPKLQKYSQKLDNLALLTNQHWVVIDEIDKAKNVYIFRANNELLISQNGKVEKAKWEYLGHNSLLIDKKDDSYLFKHGFFDENILALKVDSKEEYAFLINENKYDGELNSFVKVIDFLNKKYIAPEVRHGIESTTGVVISEPVVVEKKVKEPNYLANWFSRAFATFFDVSIFWLLPFSMSFGFVEAQYRKNDILLISLSIFFILFYLAYSSFCEKSFTQGTIGKMIFEIKVVTDQGGKLTFRKSLLRSFVKILTVVSFIFWFPVLLILVPLKHKRKKSWHDSCAGTIVVKKYIKEDYLESINKKINNPVAIPISNDIE